MEVKALIMLAVVFRAAAPGSCQPLQEDGSRKRADAAPAPLTRSLWKRFIDTSFSGGGSWHSQHSSALDNIRTRRSPAPAPEGEEGEEGEGEQCERLRLCRLHARSATSFLAAFELYFVNKENARLWDHQARTRRDCERRFHCDR